MAMMGTMSVYHPDIIDFINVKEQEGKMTTTNLSVVVDDAFMNKVINDETYWTEFNGIKYKEYRARDIFNMIVEGAWRNGEPGIIFYDAVNNGPYKYVGEEILASNPCGEQPLPAGLSCNLGSLDISKFVNSDKNIDFEKLEIAVRLGVNFLDAVVDKNSYPTQEIEEKTKKARPVGLCTMGWADYFLIKEIAYGSQESIDELEKILSFIKRVAEDESVRIGQEKGIPEWCQKLPVPRRNITLLSVAPTGSVSLIAGCSSSIEPIFSEIVIRNDKTGTYQFENDLATKPYFRCAVSANGATEVTWEEHVNIQASAQKYIDSGVSKTCNVPNHTRRETIKDIFIYAWKKGCKGITCYRNGSRKMEVLSPKKLKKDKCPVCGEDVIKFNGYKKCTKCDWSLYSAD
jgi:ribonucleoside-diphosphate reductase alpha chain